MKSMYLSDRNVRLNFVDKEGRETDDYLTALEKEAVDYMTKSSIDCCKSRRSTYCLRSVETNGKRIFEFLRTRGTNAGYTTRFTLSVTGVDA